MAVNVESWKAVASPPYDGSKTRNLMGECERSAALSARPDSSTWDESVKRCPCFHSGGSALLPCVLLQPSLSVEGPSLQGGLEL